MGFDHEYPDDWDEIRRAIYRRDGLACTECGATGCVLQCHHVIPLSMGGGNEDSNLVTLCEECHIAEHPHMQTRSGLDSTYNSKMAKNRSIPKGRVQIHNGVEYKYLDQTWHRNGIAVPTTLGRAITAQYEVEHPESQATSFRGGPNLATPQRAHNRTARPHANNRSHTYNRSEQTTSKRKKTLSNWLKVNAEWLFNLAVIVFLFRACG